MIEFLLRLSYGSIIISGGFLIVSMGRLAMKEWKAIGLLHSLSSVYFWLAMTMAAHATSLALICFARMVQSFHHDEPLSTVWGWILVSGFALLLATKIGFNWAGTRTLERGRCVWISFVASLILWVIVLAIWTWEV